MKVVTPMVSSYIAQTLLNRRPYSCLDIKSPHTPGILSISPCKILWKYFSCTCTFTQSQIYDGMSRNNYYLEKKHGLEGEKNYNEKWVNFAIYYYVTLYGSNCILLFQELSGQFIHVVAILVFVLHLIRAISFHALGKINEKIFSMQVSKIYTLSTLLPTSILMQSWFVEYRSISLAHMSDRFVNVSRRVTSYTVPDTTT